MIKEKLLAPVKAVKAFFGRHDWEDFFVKFLSVFLGIVITFSGNAYLSKKKERKEVNKALKLVCNELRDNIQYVQLADSLVKHDLAASSFLVKYQGRYADAPKDSLRLYCNAPFSVYSITASSEALELMKSSSLFAKMEHPDLALDIIHIYGSLEDYMKVVQFFADKKTKLAEGVMTDELNEMLASDNLTPELFWTKITSSVEGRVLIHELQRTIYGFDSSSTINEIEAMIKKIEERLP